MRHNKMQQRRSVMHHAAVGLLTDHSTFHFLGTHSGSLEPTKYQFCRCAIPLHTGRTPLFQSLIFLIMSLRTSAFRKAEVQCRQSLFSVNLLHAQKEGSTTHLFNTLISSCWAANFHFQKPPQLMKNITGHNPITSKLHLRSQHTSPTTYPWLSR